MTMKPIETHAEAALAELEAALGHRFARPELLERALTHRSVAHDQAAQAAQAAEAADGSVPTRLHNERLEFLGDAVLGLIIAEELFNQHPDWQEGELTRVRSQLVSRHHMAEVAAAIGLGSHLRLSRGEDRGGLRRKATVLSNTMEAVLAALFLDGGLDPVREFVRVSVMGEAAEELARELLSGAALGNYKSALQELLQATHAGSPVYRVKGESGPDHRKHFLVEVCLKTEDDGHGTPLARGVGTTKKHAEQEAARRALAKLRAATAAQPPDDAADEPDEELDSEEREQTA